MKETDAVQTNGYHVMKKYHWSWLL